jgi:hypothetical protein
MIKKRYIFCHFFNIIVFEEIVLKTSIQNY